MFEVVITTFFSSAHQLRNYCGACENLHGHNWKAEVTLCVERLNNIGIGIDFKEVKHITDHLLERLDHKNLNDLEVFKHKNPSSENIAYWLYSELSKRENLCKILKKVTIYETENFSASYYKKL